MNDGGWKRTGTRGLDVLAPLVLVVLLIAYTNDFLDNSDMAAASAGLLLINGAGSVFGPILTGWLMTAMGPEGFWVYMAVLLAAPHLLTWSVPQTVKGGSLRFQFNWVNWNGGGLIDGYFTGTGLLPPTPTRP